MLVLAKDEEDEVAAFATFMQMQLEARIPGECDQYDPRDGFKLSLPFLASNCIRYLHTNAIGSKDSQRELKPSLGSYWSHSFSYLYRWHCIDGVCTNGRFCPTRG
jgi:hypothetical protein